MTRPTVQQPSRIQAIKAELDRSVAEYLRAKDEFERTQVEFETAREKLGGITRLASEMLDTLDWIMWQITHPNIRFVAMPIGDAILGALQTKASTAANEILNDPKQEFHPAMFLGEICKELDKGGFMFRTPTPMREANAALMNLKGVTKTQDGWYQIENAQTILEKAKLDRMRVESLRKQGK